jgi:hypothetical protein
LYGNATRPPFDFLTFLNATEMQRVSDTEKTYRRLNTNVWAALRNGLPFVNFATNGNAIEHYEVFVCRFRWLALLLVASGTLTLLGAASIVLTVRATLAPDMLRYVASMAYANTNFTAPRGASALDAMDRARLLRDVRVRIGDIAAGDNDNDGDIGEVAFVTADERTVRPLDSRRLYY